MNLLKQLFGRSKPPAPRMQDSIESEPGRVGTDIYVFWPDGEKQTFPIHTSRLNAKLLDNTRTMSTVLAGGGSIARASVATGRVQTLTQLEFIAGGARVRGVQISCEGARKLVVIMFADCADVAQTKAALKIGLEQQNVSVADIESILGRFPKMPAMVIVAFGPKTDPVIDEAYGLALYLGAVERLDTQAPAAPPPDRPASSGLPVDKISLRQLALLNQRSAFNTDRDRPGVAQPGAGLG